MSNIQDFSGYNPTWCPGCGDWGIGAALKMAFTQLGYNPSDIFVVFGIGCSGNMNDFLNAYAIHSLHGRAIPNAIGAKIANHNKPTLCIVGDGDCYGEGGNHFIHAARGNHDITVIVHDNGVYGLTTGQVAPTAQKGVKSKSTPTGIIELPINPLTLAITQGATFVSQAYAGEVPFLIDMIKKAIEHKGFSIVNILQPCVTFNKINTYQYYQNRVYKLEEGYDCSDFNLSLQKAAEPTLSEKFPLGIIYKTNRPTFTDSLSQLSKQALVDNDGGVDIEQIVNDYL